MGKEKDRLEMLREAKSRGTKRPSLAEYGLEYHGGTIPEAVVTAKIPGLVEGWGTT